MADGYDRFENEGGGGGSFVMGLLTGTVLGAGLGMLFAPKSGHDIRHQIGEQAGNIANTASEGYRRASEQAGQWADRGKEMYGQAKDAVSRGVDEAQRYVRDTADKVSHGSNPQPSTASSPTSGSYGSSSSVYGTGSPSESIRGTGPESTRGGGSSGSSGSSRRS